MYHAQIQNYVPNIFVPKYFWVLEALIFGTLLPEHPVYQKIILSQIIPTVILFMGHSVEEE